MLLATAMATAKSYTVEDVPNVQLKDSRQRVSDPENLLGIAARDSINTMLARLKQTTGIEVAVVMLPSIGEADFVEFGTKLLRTWGIGGKKTNSGMLILYAEDIHRIRFENGYGLEGTMTDALSKRIQMRYMVPRFKKGDRDGGMVAGVKAVTEVLDGTMKPEQATDEEEDIPWYVAIGVVLAIVIMFLLFIKFVDRMSRRCPHCKKTALKRISTNVIKKGKRTYRRDTFICGNCGKVVTKDHDITPNDNNDIANGMIIGSMLGGGRGGGGFSGGGGGFSGGSWGGGSSGGGGASSGW